MFVFKRIYKYITFPTLTYCHVITSEIMQSLFKFHVEYLFISERLTISVAFILEKSRGLSSMRIMLFLASMRMSRAWWNRFVTTFCVCYYHISIVSMYRSTRM